MSVDKAPGDLCGKFARSCSHRPPHGELELLSTNRSRRETDSVRWSRKWTMMNELIVRELADIQRRRAYDAESLRHRKDAAARQRDRREGIRSRRRSVRCRECPLRPGDDIY